MKGTAFYYVRDGKWSKLADDLPGMYRALEKRAQDASGTSNTVAASDADMLMPELLDRAWPFITTDIAKSTADTYKHKAKQLKEIFATMAVGQLTTCDIYELHDTLLDSPGKFNNMMTVLRRSLQWAVRRGIIKMNPCYGVEPMAGSCRGRYLDDADYQKILKAADERTWVITELLYRTAQRIGDVLKIRRSHLTDEGIVFQQQKTKQRLCITWTPELRAVVKRALALDGNVVPMSPDAYLLPGRGVDVHLCYDTAHDYWSETVKRSGVKDVRFHDMRAKAATEIEAKFGIAVAQKLLGHATESMTRRYLRLLRTSVVAGPTRAAA